MTTDYFSTFITASPDSTAAQGVPPAKPHTIAGQQYALLSKHPYARTSDELLFDVHCQRSGIDGAEKGAAREPFLAKSKACLRASPLVKQHGWGLHFDKDGKVALYGVESPEYCALAQSDDVKVIPGMRSSRT
ncbi:DUF6157 family protein [Novosphingobium sp.]|uniref:DUF6157 family protein n=1 Tax=Novosphingobium sp. TaxID=1874826 RepID=UPI00286DA736|nr:DUF6157 family protein [Novosphingobium sp.]